MANIIGELPQNGCTIICWMEIGGGGGGGASNALSWQWVAGTSRAKRYYANQQNINKFFQSNPNGTFLDKEYDEIERMDPPAILNIGTPFQWETCY